MLSIADTSRGLPSGPARSAIPPAKGRAQVTKRLKPSRPGQAAGALCQLQAQGGERRTQRTAMGQLARVVPSIAPRGLSKNRNRDDAIRSHDRERDGSPDANGAPRFPAQLPGSRHPDWPEPRRTSFKMGPSWRTPSCSVGGRASNSHRRKIASFCARLQPGRLYDLSGTGEHRAWHQSRPFQLHAAELAHLPPPDQPGHLIDETLLRPKRSGCARLSVPEFFFPAW